MNPATICDIERKSINEPTPKESDPMYIVPLFQQSLINASTKNEITSVLWDFAKANGIMANLDEADKEKMKYIKARLEG